MAMSKGRIVVIVIIAVAVVAAIVAQFIPPIPSNSVLELTVAGPVAEEEWPDFGARFWEGEITVFRNLLEALDRAKRDENIVGASLEIKNVQMNFGKVQELRTKLAEFVATGKFCTVYLEQAGKLSYYLASACPEIYLTPTSGVSLTGLMGHSVFLRGTLDKLRIYPDLYHIAEYKTAKNALTETKYTAAHEEMVRSLVTSWQEQMVAGIAAGRGLEPAVVEKAIREGPYLAKEALNRKLVDKLLYADEYRDLLKEKTGTEEPKTISTEKYLEETSGPSGPRIGLVHASGTIVTGKSGYEPGIGRYMGSDTVAAALRAARQDDSVKAIVFRVDSGGGSALASEIIRRELILAKKEKPVVVSMSDVAASGGYWIAMSADKIVADPGTVTGSIGVVYGKLNVRGLYNLLGMTADHLALTSNATLDYEFENYTPEQRQTVLKFMRDIYDNFLQGVSEGRGIPVEKVHEIAKGRVWLGSQAKELGLVDELGGLEKAVELAKSLAAISAEQRVQLKIFPRPKTPWQQITEWMGVRKPAQRAARAWLDPRPGRLLQEPGWVLLPFDVQPR